MSARNVLLITADQWRGDCLSAIGHPVIKTPNLDRFAEEGVLFRRHYAGTAPCGPARACLLTGLYQMNHRVCRNGVPLDLRHITLPQMVRGAGYDPTLFGYTDSAADPRGRDPNDPSLKTYEGITPGFSVGLQTNDEAHTWLAWLTAQGVSVPREPLDIYRPQTDDIERASNVAAPYRADQTETAFLREAAEAFITDQGGSPWFVHLSFIRPHPPFIVPEPYNTLYAPDTVPGSIGAASLRQERLQHPFIDYALSVTRKDSFVHGAQGLVADWTEGDRRQIRATYYGMIAEVDDQLGRLFTALKRNGNWDNTLIIVTTDHGEMMGDHHLFGKLGYFDQAYHIPLIIHDPDRQRWQGTDVDAFTEAVDIMPTILDWLGIDIPAACDGRSLLALLEGRTPPGWRTAAHWEFDFREIATGQSDRRLGLGIDECQMAVVRDEKWKYVHFSDLPALLFDLDADPGELTNLAGDPAYASVMRDYAQRMISWRMHHSDRTLTGIELTPDGPVEAAPDRRRRYDKPQPHHARPQPTAATEQLVE